LHLTSADRHHIIGQTSAAVRLFGDAAIEDLMVPSDRPDGGMLQSILTRGCDSERGLMAGILTALRKPAVILGGRFATPTWFSQEKRFDGIAGFELRAGRLRVRSTLRAITRDVDTRIVLMF
jgi:hypothetical protein